MPRLYKLTAQQVIEKARLERQQRITEFLSRQHLHSDSEDEPLTVEDLVQSMKRSCKISSGGSSANRKERKVKRHHPVSGKQPPVYNLLEKPPAVDNIEITVGMPDFYPNFTKGKQVSQASGAAVKGKGPDMPSLGPNEVKGPSARVPKGSIDGDEDDIVTQALLSSFGTKDLASVEVKQKKINQTAEARFTMKPPSGQSMKEDVACPIIRPVVLYGGLGWKTSVALKRLAAPRPTIHRPKESKASLQAKQLDGQPLSYEALKKLEAANIASGSKKQKCFERPLPPPPHRPTICRFCRGPLRAVDKHREDGKQALECKRRNCLKFNGFTDDQNLLNRLARIRELRRGSRQDFYGWYLSDPLKYYYGMRDPLGEYDSDATVAEDANDAPIMENGFMMVRCPGQKKLCRLL